MQKDTRTYLDRKPSLADKFWLYTALPFKREKDIQEDFEYAALTNKLWRAHYLLENGLVDISARDYFALRWTARCGHTTMVDLCLDYRADINAKNSEALYLATEHHHHGTAARLIARKAFVNERVLQLVKNQDDPLMLRVILATPHDITSSVQQLRARLKGAEKEGLLRECDRYLKRNKRAADPQP